MKSLKSKVQSPKLAAAKKSAPLLILISAPSGGGKTTLCQQLLDARPDMTRVITCTTRQPRSGEKDGVDYHFLNATEFQRRVQAGDFLEYATVFGRSYGTLKSEVFSRLRGDRDILLNVDVQGAAAIRELARKEPELKRALVTVFLTPASVAELEKRLKKRGADTLEEIQKRLDVARQEVAHWRNFDYLLIGSTIPEDLQRMLAIIGVEKLRAARAAAPEF